MAPGSIEPLNSHWNWKGPEPPTSTRNVALFPATTVWLADHSPALDAQQASKVERLLAELGRDRYSPPSLPDISRDLGVDGEIVGYLIERRRIVRVSDSVAYLLGEAWFAGDIVEYDVATGQVLLDAAPEGYVRPA